MSAGRSRAIVIRQYYVQYWQKWRKSNPVDWERLYLLLLSTLAAAQDDLPLELLCAFTGVADPVPARRILLEDWRPFLTVRDAPPGRAPDSP